MQWVWLLWQLDKCLNVVVIGRGLLPDSACFVTLLIGLYETMN